MKKYLKCLPYLYFVILGVIIFTSKDLRIFATDLEYVKCGTAGGIPKPLPQMTTIVYTIFIVATPIILIGTSIYTMIKALGNKDSEEVLKAKKKIIKKFIVAAIILLIAAITRFTIGQVVTNAEDRTGPKQKEQYVQSLCLACGRVSV